MPRTKDSTFKAKEQGLKPQNAKDSTVKAMVRTKDSTFRAKVKINDSSLKAKDKGLNV